MPDTYHAAPRPWAASAIALVLLGAPTCSDRPPEPGGPSSAAPLSTAPAKASASAEKREPVFEVLRMTLTSGVRSRNPIDALEAAEAGQRVWAHVTARNRTGAQKRISVVFHVNDEERSTVDLKIDPSWSYRTWGYVTLKPADAGHELHVEVRGEGGALLAEDSLPIRAAKKR
jgi:hypothetical protein